MIVVLAPALAGASTPSGNWGNGLPLEPNTEFYDSYGYYMFQRPDWDVTGTKVYLDSYVVQRPLGDTSNAGVGNTGTVVQVFAFLGAWKDCNHDSAIGSALTGTMDYRSTLLDSGGVATCPASNGALDPLKDPVINNGQWVRELRWLTPDDWLKPDGNRLPAAASNEYPALAHVWADWGNPDSDYDPYAANPVRVDEPLSPGPKHHPDMVLHYHRETALSAVSQLTQNNLGIQTTSPTMLDPTRGLGALLCNEVGTCSGWWSDPVVVTTPGFRAGDHVLYGETTKAVRVTTYAEFAPPASGSPWTLATPPYGPGVYGAQQCGGMAGIGEGRGVQHGWDCDYSHWADYAPPTGNYRYDTYVRFPIAVGAPYQLRDTDPFSFAADALEGQI